METIKKIDEKTFTVENTVTEIFDFKKYVEARDRRQKRLDDNFASETAEIAKMTDRITGAVSAGFAEILPKTPLP